MKNKRTEALKAMESSVVDVGYRNIASVEKLSRGDAVIAKIRVTPMHLCD
jgi:hypothetical protein